MNRNTNERFATNPTNITIQRSTFHRPSTHKTTFNAGKLIPVYVDEVLPGDTFEFNVRNITRMATPMFPVMDNAYLDIYSFFVPCRLVWDHWKEFNGENTTSKWEQETEYTIPQITAPVIREGNPAKKGWTTGDLMDYFGIPTEVGAATSSVNLSVNHLPIRAYCLIWNEFFRDQNLQDPVLIDTGDSVTAGNSAGSTNSYQQNALAGGNLLPVAKMHDYFTSALPEPQKGPDVLLPLGSMAPIITGTENYSNTDIPLKLKMQNKGVNGEVQTLGISIQNDAPNNQKGPMVAIKNQESIMAQNGVIPTNLWTDLTNATAATINELRMAFQIQKLFERDARGGTRYREIIKSHFGVTSPDARMQVPEYLGGEHIPINMDQVLQTSATNETSPQGNTAAFSLTGFSGANWTKSFTEHGYILTLACVRTNKTYQQGIEKMWSRTKRFDIYWPALANIGEQPILNQEIYCQATTKDKETFGYQEAWAEYRYKPSRVSGYMRSNANGTLDSWHYADYYEKLPVLSDEWIQEDPANIDRTLASTSAITHQFIADFFFNVTCTRPMPIYSIPGLIDHN